MLGEEVTSGMKFYIVLMQFYVLMSINTRTKRYNCWAGSEIYAIHSSY